MGLRDCTTNDERVASYNAIKAVVLDYLCGQPNYCATWNDVHVQLMRAALCRPGGYVTSRTWETLNVLKREGLVQISWRHETWQLTVNGWLAITRSKQLCSITSMSTPGTT